MVRTFSAAAFQPSKAVIFGCLKIQDDGPMDEGFPPTKQTAGSVCREI